MATEFQLIFEEFSGELDALAEITTPPDLASGVLSPRARIAAGNAATLLLAALFEEFIRQEVKAAFKEKARRAANISAFPDKIAGVVWKRSMEKLARTPLEDFVSGGIDLESRISSVIAFCVKKDVLAEVGDSVAHNENNMRTSQLGGLFNSIGISSFVSRVCNSRDLVKFLRCENSGKAIPELEARIDDFFRRRNEIAHAITMGSSSGPTALASDIELFRILGAAVFLAIDDFLAEEQDHLSKSQRSLRPRRSSATTPKS